MTTSGADRSCSVAFVDLAGFTALTEVHGDHAAAGLAGRFAELAEAACGAEARVVKSIGDAVMLEAAHPRSAVAVTGRLFERLYAERELPVPRAGIHDGAVVERDGDLFGATVNLAARVAAQAHGGQVLGTEPVAAAARAAGLDAVDLGRFELRNVHEPVRLFDVRVGAPVEGGTVDPVCRMWIERERAAGRLRHAGRDHWFCSLRCAGRFAAEPDRYASE